MDFFRKLIDQGAFDFVSDWAEEQSKRLDVIDKKINKQLDVLGDELEALGDKTDAFLGTGDYENNSNRKKRKVKYGDVIGIHRIGYDHYGIYSGRNKVIHFTSLDSDISSENEIMETDLSHFFKGNKEFFILDFTAIKKIKRPKKIPATSTLSSLDFEDLMKIYSPEHTVRRARAQLGKKGYSLITNNCEHFAIWCKTGVHKSYQVDDVLEQVSVIQELVVSQ